MTAISKCSHATGEPLLVPCTACYNDLLSRLEEQAVKLAAMQKVVEAAKIAREGMASVDCSCNLPYSQCAACKVEDILDNALASLNRAEG